MTNPFWWWKPGHGGGGGGKPKPDPTPPDSDCQTMIYIGKLKDMDTDGRLGAEKAHSTLKNESFGNGNDPLHGNLVDVQLNDKNKDGVIKTDEVWNSETITHNAAGGTDKNYKVDSTFMVSNVKITVLKDGKPDTFTTTLRVMQDDKGHTFIMPPPKGAPQWEVDAITAHPIVSVTFPSQKSNYSLNHDGIFTNRHCFPCFAYGTMIETEYGTMAIQDLRVGMKVWTKDNGMQPIRWIGSRKLGAAILEGAPNLRPIRIRAGALGKDIPSRDLLVSPQHRILVRSRIAQKMFGADEVLVAAKQLLQVDGIDIATDLPEVEYFHMLFDRHEVVLSDGAETESLYTGAEALKALGAEVCEEIFTIFPQLRDMPEGEAPVGARLLASGRLGRKLAVRHARNQRALVQ